MPAAARPNGKITSGGAGSPQWQRSGHAAGREHRVSPRHAAVPPNIGATECFATRRPPVRPIPRTKGSTVSYVANLKQPKPRGNARRGVEPPATGSYRPANHGP